MSLKITVEEKQNRVYRIWLQGRLDGQTHELARRELAPVLDAKPRAVMIDLAGIEYISSMGLRVLLEARKRVVEDGGHLTIAHPQPQIEQVLEVADILPKTDIFKSVEGADTYLDAIQKKTMIEHLDVDA